MIKATITARFPTRISPMLRNENSSSVPLTSVYGWLREWKQGRGVIEPLVRGECCVYGVDKDGWVVTKPEGRM